MMTSKPRYNFQYGRIIILSNSDGVETYHLEAWNDVEPFEITITEPQPISISKQNNGSFNYETDDCIYFVNSYNEVGVVKHDKLINNLEIKSILPELVEKMLPNT